MSKSRRKPISTPIRWNGRRHADLAADLDILIVDLCRNCGFCNRLTGAELLAAHQLLDGETFARAVVVAEGAAPDGLIGWQLDIAKLFRKRYGANVSVATHARPRVD